MIHAQSPWPVRIQAALSVLLVFSVPFAIGLVPVAGGLVGFDPSAPGAVPAVELLKGIVMSGAFFAWFIVGAALGWRAFRLERVPGWRVLALAGLMGNLLVIALGVMFALGEVVNPH